MSPPKAASKIVLIVKMCDVIDAVFYINLDSRPDRRKLIEEELNKLNINTIYRFPAIEHIVGGLGCGLSHINVLREAKSRKLKNILIFEDDFTLTVSPEEFWKPIEKFFQSPEVSNYDMLLPSYNLIRSEPTAYPYLLKVIESQTTSSYIINERFYDKLLYLWETHLPHICIMKPQGEDSNGKKLIKVDCDPEFVIDNLWKRLQPENNWYAITPRLGKQRSGYSNITGKEEDYNC